MTEKSDICLLGLILLSSLFTGVSGAEVTDVIISSGESVSLSCNDSLHRCSSTTWIYSNYTTSSTVEVFAGGINQNNTKRSERLSLTSDCSLNIYNTTQHDGGVYICRQFVNGRHHGNDSSVYLHVLHVSSSSSSSPSSSSQTEIRANTSITLSCQLFSYDSCDDLLSYDGFQLVWMNQTDVDLQTDSRYQIRSDKLCLISLTTTLVNEDDNTELSCVLRHKNDIKTSVTYTVRFTDSNKILVTTTNPERFSTLNTSETTQQQSSTTTSIIIRVILVIVEVSVYAAPTVILLQIICAGRAQNRRRTQNAHPEDTVMSAV
ncbi:hypothetical protein E1301_Tti023604 [Triplophysa tibetana]|uniref:Ig-like domain-containing protein n=1 Tax=Triplophysa tibetana TaxID=1572043 RepID=A0A5A9PGV6_9TELE|nr:hypothetical protein E1301_Tti023312 [Triplophysa tibetana]KAA0721295.1 hypothetical protein E1301_Tti018160 [Triplophysa tibetana]KAA0721581.1 hypothetical protein E1301_Tti023604 [Triplophysa tibetana]